MMDYGLVCRRVISSTLSGRISDIRRCMAFSLHPVFTSPLPTPFTLFSLSSISPSYEKAQESVGSNRFLGSRDVNRFHFHSQIQAAAPVEIPGSGRLKLWIHRQTKQPNNIATTNNIAIFLYLALIYSTS